jgi:hypothetical protein
MVLCGRVRLLYVYMFMNVLLGIVISFVIILILGQIFVWEATIWTNLSIVLASIWAIFLLNAKEVIRFVEILLIELAVKILDLIAYCQGYRVCKAEGHHLEEVYKLRHRVYLETNYISEAKEHDIFVDSYDPFSTNLIVLKGKKVVGTLRIIFYNKLTKLSTLNYFNLDISDEELHEYVDVGRWVNDPEYRSKKTKNPIVTVLLGLKLYLHLLKSRKRFIMVMIKHPKLKNHIEKVFNIKFQSPKMAELNEHNYKSREEIKGYFANATEIEVGVLELKINQLFKFFIR